MPCPTLQANTRAAAHLDLVDDGVAGGRPPRSGSNNRINNNSKSQQRPTWIWSMMEWRAPAAAASRRCCAANSPSTTAAAARRLIPSFSTSSSWRSAKRRAVGGSNEARSSGSSRACSCGQQHLGVLASGPTLGAPGNGRACLQVGRLLAEPRGTQVFRQRPRPPPAPGSSLHHVACHSPLPRRPAAAARTSGCLR